MDANQKAVLEEMAKKQRGSAIIDGKQDNFRQDGYTNLLNKYGTKQDNSTVYQYEQEPIVSDMELIKLYEGNGLFTKIIDRPAEEAVKHGFDIDYGDEDIAEYVDDCMDELDFEEKFATAEKWARLYGGAIIVMLVNDGRGLEEPLAKEDIGKLEELRVFERAVVQPDYSGMYQFGMMDITSKRKFGEPEYYQVFSTYGYFTVHRSRCLVFRNGRLPEQTTNALYRYWGIPEYVKIKNALRECITAHGNGVKLLERSVQAIYKMKNLANMLSTEDGENKVLTRLQVIDMARGILNSIAIDNDGEDYDFKTLPMSGVKEVIDTTCNMLSAVTNIPQTILFGRSPAGMNATGDSDLENYYNLVENIQKQNMKANARTVIDRILQYGAVTGEIPAVPKYKMKFAALWSLSEIEQADVDQTKAQMEYTKAQTAQIYMDTNVLDPSEVRKSLASEGVFEIEEVLSDEDLNIPDDTFGNAENQISSISEPLEIVGAGLEQKEDNNFRPNSEVIEVIETGDEVIGNEVAEKDNKIIVDIGDSPPKEDTADYPAAAVIILKDGKILCAFRRDGKGVCGAGGHAEEGETPQETAIREAQEEFGITPLNLIPLGEYKGNEPQYLPSMIYFTDQYIGEPKADGSEMDYECWFTLELLRYLPLFPPFEASLDLLENFLGNYLTISNSTDTITIETNFDGGPGSGNFGHGGRPGKVSGSSGGGKSSSRKKSSENGGFRNKGSTLPRGGGDTIKNAIKDGRISTKLDVSKQSKHIKGSAKYQKAVLIGDYVSTVDIGNDELQDIIISQAGSGTCYTNGVQFKEIIDAGKIVGTYVARNGKESKTSRLTVHYSKSGCHAVPVSSKK